MGRSIEKEYPGDTPDEIAVFEDLMRTLQTSSIGMALRRTEPVMVDGDVEMLLFALGLVKSLEEGRGANRQIPLV